LAKPFIASLSGHRDGVWCLAQHPKSLSHLVSGSADGGKKEFSKCNRKEIRLWNVAFNNTLWKTNAHSGLVRGLGICNLLSSGNTTFLSCGDDMKIKLWKVMMFDIEAHEGKAEEDLVEEVRDCNMDHNGG
jgi:WD repeat and SOF domain-containing protein 1